MGFPTLKIAVFADGANREDMIKRYQEGFVKGFTTNPTLMNKAGITDYEVFAPSVLAMIKTLPISFEVFSDEFDEMERQAKKISAWGDQRQRENPDHQHAAGNRPCRSSAAVRPGPEAEHHRHPGGRSDHGLPQDPETGRRRDCVHFCRPHRGLRTGSDADHA